MFACAIAAGLLAGLTAWRNGLADWSALSALSHAVDVCHQEPRFNLALIGFGAPPLTTLLYLPFAGLLPSTAASGLACPLLGAVLLGGCAALLNGFGACVGLGRVRWLIVAALVLNGPVLSLAAVGSPGIVLALTVLGAAAALMRWAREESFRDLVTCSLMVAAAALTRYDAIWIVLTATLFVVWRTCRSPEGWARTEGTLIAFLLPIAYCYAVWIGANWAILGDPWYFLRAVSAGASEGADALSSLLLVGGVALAACPVLLGLLDHEIRGVAGRRPVGRAGAWLIVGALIGAAASSFAWPVAPGEQGYRLLGLIVPCIVIGLCLVASVAAGHLTRNGAGPRSSVWVPVVLAVLSIVGAVWARQTGHGLPAGRHPLVSEPAFASNVSGDRWIAGHIAPAGRVYITGQTAFAVSLFLGAPDRTIVGEDPELIARQAETGDQIVLSEAAAVPRLTGKLGARGCALEAVVDGSGWHVFRVAARPAPRRTSTHLPKAAH